MPMTIEWTDEAGRSLETQIEHLHICVLTGELIVGVTGHRMRLAAPPELAAVRAALPPVAAALDALKGGD